MLPRHAVRVELRGGLSIAAHEPRRALQEAVGTVEGAGMQVSDWEQLAEMRTNAVGSATAQGPRTASCSSASCYGRCYLVTDHSANPWGCLSDAT